jgi:hypothetical protein
MKRLVAAIVFVAIAALPCASQVVRGVITEKTSNAPIAGVLVWLDLDTDAKGRSVAAVLSDERGEYAIRAPEPGRYRLSAKRIGVQRYTSAPFIIGLGETNRSDLVLDAVSYTLPNVLVTAISVCNKAANAERIASLWDEAKTALTATQISLRDRLLPAQLTRYVRTLEAKSLRVIGEQRSGVEGYIDRPFVSLSGDSLSKVGYWVDSADDSTVFHAPDADVLLSEAFLRDHCFTSVEGARDGRPLVGLGFQPRRGRRKADVRGTLWLDAKSFELRSVEFRYTELPREAEDVGAGGEVHFARLPAGAWIVRRWFIRMPQFAHDMDARDGRGRTVTVVTVPFLIEAGGNVFANGVRFFEKPATITGTFVDSAGRAMAGGEVRLAGTPLRAPVAEDGSFRFDSLPAGAYTLIGEDDGYRSLGMLAGDQSVTVEEGATTRVALRAPNARAILSFLCGESRRSKRTVVRLTLVDSATNTPLRFTQVWLHWVTYVGPTVTSARPISGGLTLGTDSRGVAVFCDVPSEVPLQLAIVDPSGQVGSTVAELRLVPDEVAGRVVRIGPRR